MMKTKILMIAMAVAFTMTCNTAWAYFVRIDDLASGAPIVTTDLAGNFAGTGSATVVTGNEEATITGFLPTSTVLLPIGTSRSVIFQEPFNTQASDFVTLSIGDYQGGQGSFVQFVRIFFQSDGAASFAANLATLQNVQGTVIENGSYQDVSGVGYLDSSPLQVLIRSGEEGPTAVPEPVSLLFLGAGLVGMAVIGRKNKREAT